MTVAEVVAHIGNLHVGPPHTLCLLGQTIHIIITFLVQNGCEPQDSEWPLALRSPIRLSLCSRHQSIQKLVALVSLGLCTCNLSQV